MSRDTASSISVRRHPQESFLNGTNRLRSSMFDKAAQVSASPVSRTGARPSKVSNAMRGQRASLVGRSRTCSPDSMEGLAMAITSPECALLGMRLKLNFAPSFLAHSSSEAPSRSASLCSLLSHTTKMHASKTMEHPAWSIAQQFDTGGAARVAAEAGA